MSQKRSSMIVGALVYAATYSRNSRPLLRMWLTIAPRKAMSLPARMAT